jgi:hypothetical protein
VLWLVACVTCCGSSVCALPVLKVSKVFETNDIGSYFCMTSDAKGKARRDAGLGFFSGLILSGVSIVEGLCAELAPESSMYHPRV